MSRFLGSSKNLATSPSPTSPPSDVGLNSLQTPPHYFEPSIYQFLIKSSIKIQSLVLGRLVHSHIIKTSYKSVLFVNNSLLNMYCKFGDMPSARKLFDRMLVRDIVTWNALIAGYSQVGSENEALNVFKEARVRNAGLDRYSYAGALSACAQTGDLRNGKIVHGLVVVSGLARQSFLTNSLIDMYSEFGEIDEARHVFDYAGELDDVSWNSLLSAYVNVGWPEVAADVLVWMHRNGVKLNSFSLGSILKACSGFDDSKEVRKMLHGCVIKVGLDLDFSVGSAMVDIYAKNGGLDEAIETFECIPNPSVVVFNAMIAGFSRLGTEASAEVRTVALRLVSEMLRRRMRPSKFTFKSVIEACILTDNLEFAKQIQGQVVKNNLQEDEFIGSALISMYSNSGLTTESLKCFHSTLKKDIVIWGSMIQGYVKNEHLEGAMSLFRELLGSGGKPDQFIISSFMGGSGNLGVVRSGEQIQCYAVKSGLNDFTVCSNSQILLYTKTGDIDAAIKTFQESATIDVFTWSAMILCHALHGCISDALMLFEKMKEWKVAPNDVTFLAVLTACSHGGLLDEGLRYFESMTIEYNLIPNAKHCACIVDLLGRARRLAEAEDFIASSNFNEDPIMWRALLRSCQFHGDIERSIHAGEKLIELDPFVATSYMLLYNTYLDAGKVSLAMRTRGRMRERGVNKETSVSWIEIGASVHSFVAGGGSHPQSAAIFAKLEDMVCKLKKRGSPNVKILKSHVEILAVALGMLCLPDYVPVRVMKNLRVCGDCHVTLKLFSESERRDIVLRDQTRFHHFRWGSCSCGDYW